MRTRGLLVGAAALALAASGCGSDASSPRESQKSSSDSIASLDKLRASMPEKADFPDGWAVRTQLSPPVGLAGLNGANTGISSVEPAQCLDFAAGFISAPGSSVPGEFVSTVIAQTPEGSAVTVIATRKAGNWESPAAVRDSLRDCSNITAELSFGGNASAATFVSSPIDSGGIKAEAAGRATIIRAGDQSLSLAVVRAHVRGALVAASAQISPASGDDQRALLVRLVSQTVDKINRP